MLTHNGVINGYQSGSRVKSLTRSLSISKDTHCDANFDSKMQNAQSMDTSRGAVFFQNIFFRFPKIPIVTLISTENCKMHNQWIPVGVPFFFSKHFFPNSKDTHCDANRIRKMQTVKSRSDPHSRKLFLDTLIVYNAWAFIEFLKSICPMLILLFIRKVDPQHPRFLSSIAFSLFDRIFSKLERYIWWRQKLHFASSSPIGV